jgi:SpoVK/Ycf46/Vps4 family AAA+-type ATPase
METAKDALTRGARTNADMTALLRARNTLLWVVTREEMRVERAITEASAAARFKTRLWDCADGIHEFDEAGKRVEVLADAEPAAALGFVGAQTERHVYVMRDLHKWLDPVVLRKLRNLARSLQRVPTAEARAIVVLSPSGDIPPELAGHATLIDYPLPDRAEMAAILNDTVASLKTEELRAGAVTEGTRDAAIDAAVGLSAEEAANCYARSIVLARRIDPMLVSAEKRRVIARERVLTWYEPDRRGFDAIGGLDVLKKWLRARRAGFGVRARAFGLPCPKGAMLVGVPGCGKSLTAKCIAAAWGMPLLRLDLGALRSKYVGESEGNIRKALAVAEAVAPCVLWLDEIEKALGGATGPQGDGGVAADALGAVLSWMQEREGSVFVVATANDVRSLPPELLRKGRFDEVFWIDLPTREERESIVVASLAAHGRTLPPADCAAVAEQTEGFAGAEIAALVPDALFAAFEDGERDVRLVDLTAAAKTVSPLSKTAAEKITGLREWAKGRARPASLPEKTLATTGRELDLEP